MASPGFSGINRRALIVATVCDSFKKTGEPTGCWLEEVAAPYMTWVHAGYHVDITTPGGAPVPWDPASLEADKMSDVCHFMADGATCVYAVQSDNNVVQRIDPFKYYAYAEMAQLKCKAPLSISKILNASEYNIVFLAGGHGAMFDFPDNKTLSVAIGSAVAANRVIAAVCHGVGGLLHVTDPRTGQLFLAGKRACSFTNEEEKIMGKNKVVPFALEPAVAKCGASFDKGAPWTSHVVRDGQLVTGQNPQSSAALAEECLRAADELSAAPITPRPK